MKKRNAAEKEVVEVIKQGKWVPAEKGRLTSKKTFLFSLGHYRRYYFTKEVVPIFME